MNESWWCAYKICYVLSNQTSNSLKTLYSSWDLLRRLEKRHKKNRTFRIRLFSETTQMKGSLFSWYVNNWFADIDQFHLYKSDLPLIVYGLLCMNTHKRKNREHAACQFQIRTNNNLFSFLNQQYCVVFH